MPAAGAATAQLPSFVIRPLRIDSSSPAPPGCLKTDGAYSSRNRCGTATLVLRPLLRWRINVT